MNPVEPLLVSDLPAVDYDWENPSIQASLGALSGVDLRVWTKIRGDRARGRIWEEIRDACWLDIMILVGLIGLTSLPPGRSRDFGQWLLGQWAALQRRQREAIDRLRGLRQLAHRSSAELRRYERQRGRLAGEIEDLGNEVERPRRVLQRMGLLWAVPVTGSLPSPRCSRRFAPPR